MAQASPPTKEVVQGILHKEFTGFFTTMTAADESGWPHISDQQLVDAIADALLTMGKQRGKGVALLQTLVHELQDRVNLSLN